MDWEVKLKGFARMFFFFLYAVSTIIIEVTGNDVWQGRRLLNATDNSNATSSSTDNDEPNTIWEKIVVFYSDKNNMAMYLVLPSIVLIYGGCCLIYCIARCRQYCKKKSQSKQKQPLMSDVDDSTDTVTTETERPRTPRNKVAPAKPATPSSVNVALGGQDSGNLPCEVPASARSKSSTKSPPPPYKRRPDDTSTAFGGPAKPAYPYRRGTPMGGATGRDDPAARNAEMKAYIMARQILQFDDPDVHQNRQKKRLVFTAN